LIASAGEQRPVGGQLAQAPELVRPMLGRALDAGVPARWVTADETSDAV
jgi:hypothetical protein